MATKEDPDIITVIMCHSVSHAPVMKYEAVMQVTIASHWCYVYLASSQKNSYNFNNPKINGKLKKAQVIMVQFKASNEYEHWTCCITL